MLSGFCFGRGVREGGWSVTNLDAGLNSSPARSKLPLPQLHQLKLLSTIKKRHKIRHYVTSFTSLFCSGTLRHLSALGWAAAGGCGGRLIIIVLLAKDKCDLENCESLCSLEKPMKRSLKRSLHTL